MTYTLYFLKGNRSRKSNLQKFDAKDDQAAQGYAEALCEESEFILLNVFTEKGESLYEIGEKDD